MSTANAIRIKRRKFSDAAGKPSSLQWGELAYNEADSTLYYGYGSGTNGENGIVNSTDIHAIGGSGQYVDRFSDQTVSGTKTFLNNVNITGNLNVAGNSISFTEASVVVTTLTAFSGVFNKLAGSGLDVIAPNTDNESVGYFAVFDTDPNSAVTTLKSVSKSVILDDIGAATSGLSLTAGSGLQGGGTLSEDRTFDIGQGDGISISANDVSVDDTVVRTSGNQSISGVKIFMHDAPIFSGGLSSIAAHTSSNNVEYFAVFDTDPASLAQTLKSVSKSDVLDDIGGASSGLTLTAGSGLQGGGTLSENRTLDVITGYGIDISNDAVVVDTFEVVVTTGIQSVSGVKTFANNIVFQSGFIGSGVSTLQAAASAVDATYFPVFTGSPINESQNIVSRTASEVKGDIGLSNVTNDAQVKKLSTSTNGYVPTWNGTTGDALNNGYSIETTLTGADSALPRADAVKTYVDNLLASNDAMIFKGVINASADPLYPAADRGWTYKISVAGKIGGANGPVVEVNDTIICTVDSTAEGDHATVGGNWVILQTNIVDKDILVTGPSNATNANIAVFDGTTGKAIKDVSIPSSHLVLATGNQTVSGVKVFRNEVASDSVSGYFIPISGNDSDRNLTSKLVIDTYTPFEVVYDTEDSSNTTLALRRLDGTPIVYNVGNTSVLSVTNATISGITSIKAPLSGPGAAYFPVFLSEPGTQASQLYSRSSAQVKNDIGLANVENTALSTWAGSTNITTLGTITTGTWSANAIAVNKGGTGQTTYSNGELLIGSGTSLVKNTLSAGDGISVTNGSGSITVATNSYVVKTTGTQTINGLKTFGDRITITGSPIIVGSNFVQGNFILNSVYGNMIQFGANGSSSAPTDGYSPSGTKLLLQPAANSETLNVSLGLNNLAWWHSVPSTSWDYEWYAGGSKIATLFGDGTFNTTNISGTNFYLNGTKIDSTATQLNLLSTGNDGEILIRSGGNFTRQHMSAAVYSVLYSNSLTTGYSNSQATIEHKNNSLVSSTATNFPSGTVISNLSFDAYGHVVNASGSNLDERYVQISNLDTSLNFVSGITSEYDVGNKILNVFHDDTCPSYNDSSNTLGVSGIASITFDNYGHITGAEILNFLTADNVCEAIVGCTIDGGTF